MNLINFVSQKSHKISLVDKLLTSLVFKWQLNILKIFNLKSFANSTFYSIFSIKVIINILNLEFNFLSFNIIRILPWQTFSQYFKLLNCKVNFGIQLKLFFNPASSQILSSRSQHLLLNFELLSIKYQLNNIKLLNAKIWRYQIKNSIFSLKIQAKHTIC